MHLSHSGKGVAEGERERSVSSAASQGISLTICDLGRCTSEKSIERLWLDLITLAIGSYSHDRHNAMLIDFSQSLFCILMSVGYILLTV